MSLISSSYAAFRGHRRIALGSLAEVAVASHKALREGHDVVVFAVNNETGKTVDLDLRGTDADVEARYADESSPPRAVEDSPAVKGRGRPRLGVVAREVTLLPEHWEWLSSQSGGASVALRKLVLQAMRQSEQADLSQKRRDRTYAFMSAIAGDLPGFEEASRALFAGDVAMLATQTQLWPEDVRGHALWLLGTQS